MNSLRKTADQFRETFLAMPMQSRVIAVMLVAAIAIGLGMLVRGGSSPDTVLLFGGRTLDETELDAAEIAFSRSGLSDWVRVGRRIEIPKKNRNEYLAALEESDALPLSLRSSIQAAIESASPFESSQQREARTAHAKERSLGDKISSIDEIRWASVEYDIGERRGLSRSRPQSASVVVQPEGPDPLPRHQTKMIQDMIKGSYAGMAADDVTVIDTNANTASTHSEDEDPLLRKRHEAEARFEAKVRRHLAGYGQIRVAAYAEIDPTMDLEKTVLMYDSQPTITSEKSRSVESETNRPVNQGVPGVEPNAIGNRAASIEEDLETSRIEKDERESTKVAGQEYEVSRMASLQVKRIRVSVGLPKSYYRKIWDQQYLQSHPETTVADVPAMTTADLQELRDEAKTNIQSAVTPLLPDIAAGEDKFDQLVEVWDYPDLPEPVEVETQSAELALTWLAESWQTIAMVLLALVALLVARSAAKGGGGGDAPAEFAEGFGLELPTQPEEAEEAERSRPRPTITGGTLQEELVTLVEKNPEVAANVIRGWVGEAA